MMKQVVGLLAITLALSACGDDKPKKKKAEAVAETAPVQTAPAPQSTPAPRPAPVAEQDTQPEYTPPELPTDSQSGYKAYIEEQPAVPAQQMVAVQPESEPAMQTEVIESTEQMLETPAVSPTPNQTVNPGQPVGMDNTRPFDAFSNPSAEMVYR